MEHLALYAYKYLGLIAHVAVLAQILTLTISWIAKLQKEDVRKLVEYLNLAIVISCFCLLLFHLAELLKAHNSGYLYDQFAFFDRALGSYWWHYIFFILSSLILPQLLWKKSNRTNFRLSLILCLVLLSGLWYERIYTIIVSFFR